jgi:hypothetical protein
VADQLLERAGGAARRGIFLHTSHGWAARPWREEVFVWALQWHSTRLAVTSTSHVQTASQALVETERVWRRIAEDQGQYGDSGDC